MSGVFLGRLSHWLALVAIAGVLWLVGEQRFHVLLVTDVADGQGCLGRDGPIETG